MTLDIGQHGEKDLKLYALMMWLTMVPGGANVS
jgi:hypothetical protein